METVAIILAGGKGTRLDSEQTQVNKTALKLAGKPLIRWGIEAVEQTVDGIVVVVGAYKESVKNAIGETTLPLYFVEQHKQLGTGHAVQVAQPILDTLQPKTVLIGYGDHMMFYTSQLLQAFTKKHNSSQAALSLITAHYEKADIPAWGRVIKNENGTITKIVEQKDATDEEKQVRLLNVGFYAADYQFLTMALPQLTPSPATNEYYITDLVEIAIQANKTVEPFEVPYAAVGQGVNTQEDLKKAAEMFKNLS